jgi:hypothetical protein
LRTNTFPAGPGRGKFLPGFRGGATRDEDATPALSRGCCAGGLRADFGTIDAFVLAVTDPPVTPDERLADATAAFGLLCDRAIEYLDLLRWEDAESPGTNG